MSAEETSDRYLADEQQTVLRVFQDLLRVPTKDGGQKRKAGAKVPWWLDGGHEGALFRHLARWKSGALRDADSGAHALVHLAWRALALAYQETYGRVDPNAVAVQLWLKEDTRG